MHGDSAERPADRLGLGPIRWRAVAVAGLVGAVAASTAILGGPAGGGAASLTSTSNQIRTGAWICPHGGGAGLTGWVTIANPGRSAVHVRLTGFGANGVASPASFDVPGGTEAVRPVQAGEPGSATEVEYFGGWVVASATVAAGSGPEGRSTQEPCLPGPAADWYLPGLSTKVGQTAYVVATNPFGEVAEFDVALFTEQRSIRPGTLSPFVVPPRHSVAIKLNQFALLSQDENALAVRVASRVGRIVVGGTVLTRSSMMAEAGVPAPATRWVIPAGGAASDVRLVAFNPGSVRADLSVVSQGPAGQLVGSGTEGLSVPPGGVQSFALRALPDAGMTVQSTNGRPVVVALRAERTTGGPTIAGAVPASGAAAGGQGWLVVPGVLTGSGSAYLVMEDPGTVDAEVQVSWIGPGGPIAAFQGPFTVPAGRTLQVPIPRVGTRLGSAWITVTKGEVIPAAWSSPAQGSGFAIVLGLPTPAQG